MLLMQQINQWGLVMCCMIDDDAVGKIVCINLDLLTKYAYVLTGAPHRGPQRDGCSRAVTYFFRWRHGVCRTCRPTFSVVT